MANEVLITMRLPAELMDRVTKLEARMQGTPEAAAWRVSRSSVIRLALVSGLAALETKYSGAERSRCALCGQVAELEGPGLCPRCNAAERKNENPKPTPAKHPRRK